MIVDYHQEVLPGLGPPQFRLRTLMLGMTLLSALFALMAALDAVWSLLLVFFLALVAAHVGGNALGTRLRDSAAGLLPETSHNRSADSLATSLRIAPAGRMHETTRPSRWMLAMAAAGAVLGGIGGGITLTCFNWQQITPAGMVLASVSSAVLGGFFGFLAGSFLSVFSHALGEALNNGDAPALSSRARVS